MTVQSQYEFLFLLTLLYSPSTVNEYDRQSHIQPTVFSATLVSDLLYFSSTTAKMWSDSLIVAMWLIESNGTVHPYIWENNCTISSALNMDHTYTNDACFHYKHYKKILCSLLNRHSGKAKRVILLVRLNTLIQLFEVLPSHLQSPLSCGILTSTEVNHQYHRTVMWLRVQHITTQPSLKNTSSAHEQLLQI